ncbi:conserved hypothetical protein [Bathymodiolus platifrons methanotrophic gill symbiont]|uniref:MobV family relaxase n=1 Tax=Bathymodiolus platifrons methanotrophic gill symbiont TaxID=113268 RepID=UPI000B415072|nr:MobV family relaxase [Bathymodiolus platifrons methanotrophic gill symbiont]GAW87434.1 conserved hypothetical protein [Bathymodiolus platifrons methanotrophic gill symbiont]GFO76393.1 hypothetical protein BPLS_P4140 [Bathymodiolus platifrons methanotrophic gill symbiont]
MAKFAILRTQKLKSRASIKGSLKHAFREQKTPNSDAGKRVENTHIGANNSSDSMDKINAILPEKIRKNGVMAIEYLITGSPEAIRGKSRFEQDDYFKDSLEWLKQRHGVENIAYVGIHRDESTPHMYAYIVPIDPKGKLNARHFLGERNALSKMQTDFYENVGKEHGLERGIEKSKAKHVDIKSYYARVNATEVVRTPPITLDKPKLWESKSTYGFRVAKKILKDLRGVAIFAKACFGHPSPSKQQKLNATTYASGGPDSSSSPRPDPTRGRNIGSK